MSGYGFVLGHVHHGRFDWRLEFSLAWSCDGTAAFVVMREVE
jgi:hypothetical protein